MKKVFIVLTLALAGLAGRAEVSSPDLIAQIHFAGAEKILADTNSVAFTNTFCSAEALALRAQTADKLAAFLVRWLPANTKSTAVPASAAQLRPLLDDLQTAEWFLEARAATGERPEVALAIRIAPARAQIWATSLKPFLPAASFKNSNGWLIFESGTGTQKLGERLAQKISAPTTGWLTADVNWPRLAQWYPQLKSLGVPETQVSLKGHARDLQVFGKFLFPEKLTFTLEDWRIPTNTIHLPFVSLTAVRGFSGWLKTQAWASPGQIFPAPNQMFVWALPQVPFQTFAAVPVTEGLAALTQLYTRLKPVVESGDRANPFMIPFSLQLTNTEINFQGVPFVSPFIRAVKEPGGQFLLAGAFPNTPKGAKMPPDLLALLARKNLVLYHWEITSERMPQVLNMSQLGLLINSCKQLNANSAAFKWLQKIQLTTGVSVTEILQTGPAEMTFTRRATCGFTAVELYALANWLEAGNFPGCNLSQPPPKRPGLKNPRLTPKLQPAPPAFK